MEVMEEPNYASVVMAHGTSGTAWQRFYVDGLWHSTSGRVKSWQELQNENPSIPLILIHDNNESM